MVVKKTDLHQNSLIVLFKIGHVLLTNSPLDITLNLLESAAKIWKLSKFMAQLHCNKWSDIGDCLTLLSLFPLISEIPMCLAGIKVEESFSVISDLAVTTFITINYSRVNFFLKWIFKSNEGIKSTLWSKNGFQFTIR